MGLASLEDIIARLREHGAPAERAAAVIEEGTRATQRVILGSLADLSAKVREASVGSPALLIVGEVARLHETLQWFNSTRPDTNDLFAIAGNEGRLSA
jgi:siroheme synthase